MNILKEKRVHLMVIYSIIFAFSLFAIFQMRFYLRSNEFSESDGKFMLWFFGSSDISHSQFIMVKLSLFVITGVFSYILLMTNYFMYKHPKLEDRIISRAHHELRKELEEIKHDKEKKKLRYYRV